MKEIEAIRRHPVYIENYGKLMQAEQNRKFCRHQFTHLLDVARIAYIHNLEERLGFRKETIYAAALLHDIGKYRQYKEGTPHEIAGAELASTILSELPADYFSGEEKGAILTAVRGHRKLRQGMEELEELLYRSDKQSRMCFACAAQLKCDWEEDKKNMEIEI